MEVKAKILAKKGDNKAFKASDGNWYNLNDNVVPYLEKLNKGDEVVIQFEKKGVSRYVSKIVAANEVSKETAKESTGFTCEVCGAALKDGKYKKCYNCNKSGATKKEEPKEEVSDKPTCKVCGKELKDDKYDTCYVCNKKGGKSSYNKESKKTSFDSPERTAQIQRGNALNAASMVASSQQFADPETAKQFTLMLADDFLVWLRAE